MFYLESGGEEPIRQPRGGDGIFLNSPEYRSGPDGRPAVGHNALQPAAE